MPLLTEKPPKGFEKVLDASVAELVGHGAVPLGTRERAAVSAPVRVHHLGADAVAAGKGLAAARPTGWLATLTTDGEVREQSSSCRPSQAGKASSQRRV